jgi:hypothetical protein
MVAPGVRSQSVIGPLDRRGRRRGEAAEVLKEGLPVDAPEHELRIGGAVGLDPAERLEISVFAGRDGGRARRTGDVGELEAQGYPSAA